MPATFVNEHRANEPEPPHADDRPHFAWLMFAALIALFCTRNLPWHLDDFDQAKQAYVSFEMVRQNHWLFQHTPMQSIATKPPLAGWISALIFFVARGWEIAWRLPSLAPALAIITVLWRSLRPQPPALFAVLAFACNHFTPHLATLVRTDMLLTFFIFLCGWKIFGKLRDGSSWSARDQWTIFFCVLGSMFTKGPIAYAFLFPGLVAFAILCRRKKIECRVWSGAWTWFAPLLLFAAWVLGGILQSHEFYEQVVLKEFLGRFTTGEHAVHKNQPLYFYFTHLLLKFFPWSALLIALLFFKKARGVIASKPHLLWLACWALGGLVCMSLVPSKRPDRIFPVIPPLAMLLACLCDELRDESIFGWKIRRIASTAAALALAITMSAATFYIVRGFAQHADALVKFGERARLTSQERNWPLAAVSGRDEGMLLYLGLPKFILFDEAGTEWQRRKLAALVLPEKIWRDHAASFPGARELFVSQPSRGKNSRYVFIVRDEAL